jgi:hypothetical protein
MPIDCLNTGGSFALAELKFPIFVEVIKEFYAASSSKKYSYLPRIKSQSEFSEIRGERDVDS